MRRDVVLCVEMSAILSDWFSDGPANRMLKRK